jgi:cysteine synthase A
MMDRAAEISASPDAFYADQFNNEDAIVGYASLGREIAEQTGGEIDAFVQAVGTSHCIAGVAQALRVRRPDISVVAVEPAESAVLSGGQPGSHQIEGVGVGFIPPMWDPKIADEVVPVSTAEAWEMCRQLAREEGLLGGASSGANIVAAIRVARRLGAGRTVVTLQCDSGIKYLSTDLYSAT